ncbi:MAG: methyltransferase domain-containing protein [Candidatus Bathycorpusculaceae bacterium]
MNYFQVSKASQLDSALNGMYERLAIFIMHRFNINNVATALEVGCGKGGLTIPLAKKIRGKCVLIAYDFWLGPYAEGLSTLKNAICREGLDDVVEIIEGDVREMGIRSRSVNLIISNKLFCDLDNKGLERALKEFYRILKNGGEMVHAEMDPNPKNKAQELLITADLKYSMEPLPFKGERWFSPTVKEISNYMQQTGFNNIQIEYFQTNLRLEYEAAIEQLKRWRIDTAAFLERHKEDLQKYGIELHKSM